MAQRLASLIQGDWEDVAELIEQHPELGPRLAEAKAKMDSKRRFTDIRSGTDASHAATQLVLDLAMSLAKIGQGREAVERLDSAKIVLVRDELPVLTSRVLSDGGYLVTVSDTFPVLTSFILDLFRSVQMTTCVEDRHLAITAARFYLLSQCIEELSMTVEFNAAGIRTVQADKRRGLWRDRRAGGTGAPRSRAGVAYTPVNAASDVSALFAMVFAVLHELGHVALGHLEPSDEDEGDDTSNRLRLVSNEREADEFAAGALSRVASIPGMSRVRKTVVLGIHLALLVVEFRRVGLFVRPTTIHDPYDQRVARAMENIGWPGPPDGHMAALRGVLQVAVDFTCHMNDGWWDDFYASPAWITHLRPQHHNTFVSQVDSVLGRSPDVNLRVLDALGIRADVTPSVQAVLEGGRDVQAMLESFEVEDVNTLTDPAVPLSRQELLTQLAASPIWASQPEMDNPTARRGGAFVLMELLEPHLQRKSA
jgi:hypothetical protein